MWAPFLETLARKDPEAASVLRQGSPKRVRKGKVEVFFHPLYAEQVKPLLDEQRYENIEGTLEELVGGPIPVDFVFSDNPDEDLLDSASENQRSTVAINADEILPEQKCAKDPAVRLLQKVLGVKIEYVFSEKNEPKYHLGMNGKYNRLTTEPEG